MKEKFLKYLGVERYRVSHTEKFVSMLGAFLGIFIISYTSNYFLQSTLPYLIVASMGASAVLLFAVPHSPLSQPWSLIGGHLLSALIGVSCAILIPDTVLAASLAVGLAVGVMYYAHCIHPPGGATALSAVVGGAEIHQMGYQFVITPVLINVIVIISIAIIFNYLFKWRRYPAYLAQKQDQSSKKDYGAISHEDFVYALSEFESFIDISENDLLKIYEVVTKRHQSTNIQHHALQHGHFYSNGEYGNFWSVRQIVDWDISSKSGEEQLIYKTIAGANRRNSGVMTKNEFTQWAKHEVIRDEDNWRRIDNNNL
ncbi:MAG: HPP family protein [Gammaproteobacteria bacterium]|nr:HPP family protein [Gammaproteobacteria bacterium]